MERENIVKMKQNCDFLRLKASANKTEVLDMLNGSNSVEQHVYFQKEQAPERIQSYAKSTLGYAARA